MEKNYATRSRKRGGGLNDFAAFVLATHLASSEFKLNEQQGNQDYLGYLRTEAPKISEALLKTGKNLVPEAEALMVNLYDINPDISFVAKMKIFENHIRDLVNPSADISQTGGKKGQGTNLDSLDK